MNMIQAVSAKATPAYVRLPRLAAMVLLAAVASGCVPTRPSQPSPVTPLATPTADAPIETGEFIVAAGMNDTWNTVGQILVSTNGVSYESRAQMLGIYGLRYRGERFLIRTQAVTTSSSSKSLATRVLALELDGKPKQSAAAIALLEVLKKRVPLEIEKYTSLLKLRAAPKPQPKPRTKKRSAKGGR